MSVATIIDVQCEFNQHGIRSRVVLSQKRTTLINFTPHDIPCRYHLESILVFIDKCYVKNLN